MQFIKKSVIYIDIDTFGGQTTMQEQEKELNIDYSSGSGDNFIKDLLRTENEITQDTLNTLRNRYEREKEQWEKLSGERKNDVLSMKTKLSETEQRLKQLRDEYAQDKISELEQLKGSIDGLKEKREKEEKKWESVEDKIKLYRQLAEKNQERVINEQNRIVQIRERHEQESRLLRQDLNNRERDILKLQEEVTQKQQDWANERLKYEENTKQLTEQIKKLEEIFQNQQGEQFKSIEKKDENSVKLQKALQDVMVQFTQEKHINELLNDEINKRDKHIKEVEHQYQNMLEQMEGERNKWKQDWQKDITEWDQYKEISVEKEQKLKEETEDQLNRLISMIDSLEVQLNQERELNKSLGQKVGNLQEFQSKAYIDKRGIVAQHEKICESKELEIKRLNNEMIQLKANIGEEERTLHFQKLENQKLKDQNEQIKYDRQRILQQFDQDRAEWKKTLLEEQLRFEEHLRKLNERNENVLRARQSELNQLEEDLATIEGELNEIRVIYKSVKVENHQQKAQISAFETELKKVREQWEKERKEWENLLIDEQSASEKRKKDILLREGSLRAVRDTEFSRLRFALDETVKKLIELEGTVQNRDEEVRQLIMQVNSIETQKAKMFLFFDDEQKRVVEDFEKQLQITENRNQQLLNRQYEIVRSYDSEISKLNQTITQLRKK